MRPLATDSSPRSPRSRRRLLAGVVAVALLAGACSGDDDSEPAAPTSTTVAVGRVDVALQRGEVTVFGVADGAVLPDDAERAALVASERYVQSAMVSPLARGEVGERFVGLFAPALQPLIRPGGRDHAVLTDDGIPGATATPEVTTTPVAIDALIAADGTPLMLVTAFRARTEADAEPGPVAVGRVVQLTFEQVEGEWLVTAYKVTTTRRGPGEPTTTTATAEAEEAA